MPAQTKCWIFLWSKMLIIKYLLPILNCHLRLLRSLHSISSIGNKVMMLKLYKYIRKVQRTVTKMSPEIPVRASADDSRTWNSLSRNKEDYLMANSLKSLNTWIGLWTSVQKDSSTLTSMTELGTMEQSSWESPLNLGRHISRPRHPIKMGNSKNFKTPL